MDVNKVNCKSVKMKNFYWNKKKKKSIQRSLDSDWKLTLTDSSPELPHLKLLLCFLSSSLPPLIHPDTTSFTSHNALFSLSPPCSPFLLSFSGVLLWSVWTAGEPLTTLYACVHCGWAVVVVCLQSSIFLSHFLWPSLSSSSSLNTPLSILLITLPWPPSLLRYLSSWPLPLSYKWLILLFSHKSTKRVPLFAMKSFFFFVLF